MSNLKLKSFVETLQERATNWQSKEALYHFVDNGGKTLSDMTFLEADTRAKSIAAVLQREQKIGSRALLLFPSNKDFISAFFGCLYAGVIAVPAYPPHPALLNRMLPRILTIIRDSSPDVVLTDSSIYAVMKSVRELLPELQKLKWILTDQISDDNMSAWIDPHLSPDTLALIQYTSGSTGTPKGVMISQENLAHNCSLITECKVTTADVGVTWAPVYHDMGLIFGMLTPAYCGFSMTVLSPIDFLKRPYRWLKAVSETKATFTCAPNFAYDLCVRKVTDEELSTLDLSHLAIASVSAEPVRAETLERFHKKFAKCGFRNEAFRPAYGMAESTLLIATGKDRKVPHVILDLDANRLEQNEVVPATDLTNRNIKIVGSGTAIGDMRIEIVDAKSGCQLKAREIGEIWIAGPSIAQGYWQNPEETKREFSAFIKDTKEGPFFRTGDLGFKDSTGELFITGRLKDLIIINGKNHYPQDIERSVEQAHAPIRAGCVAAFGVQEDGVEKVIIVAEVERRRKLPDPTDFVGMLSLRVRSVLPGFDPNYPVEFDESNIMGEIRKSVSEVNAIHLHEIILIKAGSIPKTSSGKIQRRACREAYEKKEFTIIAQWFEGQAIRRVA